MRGLRCSISATQLILLLLGTHRKIDPDLQNDGARDSTLALIASWLPITCKLCIAPWNRSLWMGSDAWRLHARLTYSTGNWSVSWRFHVFHWLSSSNYFRSVHKRYVGVILYVFHVLQLFLIRFTYICDEASKKKLDLSWWSHVIGNACLDSSE